jgi:predicted nucleic acid-binding protein
MITAVDSNVFIALWDADHAFNRIAHSILETALQRGRITLAAPAYAELMAGPGRTEGFLDGFCRETGISVDWELGERIWRDAGLAFQRYAQRRRKQAEPGPRRILTDFLIGAHAMHRASQLLTLDNRIYKAAFPRLSVITI